MVLAQSAGKPIIDMHMHAYELAEFGPEPPRGCAGANGIVIHGRRSRPAVRFLKARYLQDDARRTQDGRRPAYRDAGGDEAAQHCAGDDLGRPADRCQISRRQRPTASFPPPTSSPTAATPAAYAVDLENGGQERRVESLRGKSPPNIAAFRLIIHRLSHSTPWPNGSTYRSAFTWATAPRAGLTGSTQKYRASLGNPLLLEELLIRHPKMRVYVMHAAVPMVDELLMLLYSHPQVYVDISGDNWGVPARGISPHVEADRRGRIWRADNVWVRPDGVAVGDRHRHRQHQRKRRS